jgi:hypothetical protein
MPSSDNLYSICCWQCTPWQSLRFMGDDEPGPGGWWKARSFLDWLFDRPRQWIECDVCNGSGMVEHN